ncbi:hypothetical protein SCHPADRAFT_892082 [Schizopora paradoxa]|uniref:Phosphatidylglycerol/phosphatidylinositol transfer protein n=1 Tax=Schizopora paradoxa TaxID=27342 RepID=A0A0H2RGQ5_9AGAM|nr:hypothetical protein SCHPADRAFT_892082 [Schizopora paradoxa]
MKSVFTILAIAGGVLAQGVQITFPFEGLDLIAGTPVNVQVTQLETTSSLQNMGIAVAFQHCPQDPCSSVSEAVGPVFFVGPHNPQFSEPPSPIGGPYQNVTVTIPSNIQKGLAIFSVPHAALVGADAFFFTEIANVTVNIV